MVVPQQYTSARTSRKQVPALHRALLRAGVWKPQDVNADIGGGRWNLASEALARAHVLNLVYDPFNRPSDHNAVVLPLLDRATTATVSNVLCVIREPEARIEVIKLAALAPVAYFTVYEGNRSSIPGPSRDGWQENRKLATYLDEINQVMEAELQTLGGLRMIVAKRVATRPA